MAACLTLNAQSAQGLFTYALPQTSLKIEVSVSKEVFYAGPYARFSQKYLGIEVRQQDETTCSIKSVNIVPSVEADQSARYALEAGRINLPEFIQLTSQGLIAGQGESFSGNQAWRFPASNPQSDFASKGIPANLTSESSTLYKSGTSGEAVTQNMVVEKSTERKAQEVAQKIFDIRDKRYKILIGDTDATYSGEAMKATIDALGKLEADYLTLFTGYSETLSQSASFEVIPSKDNAKQMYIAFRLSDTEGLLPSDDMSGKPYLLELSAESITMPEAPVPTKKTVVPEQFLHYRIPAICNVRLTDGLSLILHTRIPVYQLGIEETLPVFSSKK